MSYVLLGSVRSPFVRACRLLLLENRIPFEFRVLNFVDDPSAAEALCRETPINRVPVLFDGSQKIFDSRVIARYLIQKHGLQELSVGEENYISAIYSGLDAGVTLFLMKKDGFAVDGTGFFVSRQRKRIPDNLKFLESWARTLKPERDWHFPAMALFSFLFWIEKRGLASLRGYPEHINFLDRFKDSRGVSETSFSL